MKLRYYQKDAVDAVYDYLRRQNGNPCVVLPTGGGKSCILAQICIDATTRWNGRTLILTHVKELVEQNASTIRRLAPELHVGVYSAGLRSRETDAAVIVRASNLCIKKPASSTGSI